MPVGGAGAGGGEGEGGTDSGDTASVGAIDVSERACMLPFPLPYTLYYDLKY